ncbi:MAG TPA: hypothetical protein DHW02_17965 [Ktedonobacter sp.]|nr:hypothetical protein [Ktedonobacter sp.]
MSSKPRGNLIIGQSGGATAVTNTSLVGAFEAAQADERIGDIYRRIKMVTIITSEAIHDEQGHFLGTAQQEQGDTFHHAQMSGAGKHWQSSSKTVWVHRRVPKSTETCNGV